MAWKNFIGPWFFQKAPTEEMEADNEKKMRKQDRRLKRQQN